MAQQSLKEQTARGLLWGGLSNTLMQLLGALFGLALMQLLTPADWGKVAMLNIFAALASTLQESGFIAALCNRKTPSDNDYNSVFRVNLTVSTGLYLFLWFMAPLIARFYNDDELIPLARFLFLGFLFSGLGTVQRAYLFGHLMVRETSICNISAMLVSNSLGVVLAYLGFAYWGIVAQQVTFVLAVQVLSWYFSSWRPSLRIDLRPAAEMFRFSCKLLLTNVFRNLYDHAFSVLLGRWFGQHRDGHLLHRPQVERHGLQRHQRHGQRRGPAHPGASQWRQRASRACLPQDDALRSLCQLSRHAGPGHRGRGVHPAGRR